MGIIQMYERIIYKSRDIVNNIDFEDDSKTIDLCNAVGQEASTIVIHDLNGNLDPNKSGRPGFVVTNESKMTMFVGGAGCKPIMDTCTQFYQETCLWNVVVSASGAFSMENIEMVISDDTKEALVPWLRIFSFV